MLRRDWQIIKNDHPHLCAYTTHKDGGDYISIEMLLLNRVSKRYNLSLPSSTTRLSSSAAWLTARTTSAWSSSSRATTTRSGATTTFSFKGTSTGFRFSGRPSISCTLWVYYWRYLLAPSGGLLISGSCSSLQTASNMH